MGAEDTVVGVEVVGGEFGGETLEFDRDAVVGWAINEIKLLWALANYELLVFEVVLGVLGQDQIGDIDIVDSIHEAQPSKLARLEKVISLVVEFVAAETKPAQLAKNAFNIFSDKSAFI